LCQQGEARKALEIIQHHNVPVDLVVQNFFTYFSNDPNLKVLFFSTKLNLLTFFMQYKFAPDLIMLDAYETVESWMMARNKLNPGKLIPAMMRYVSEPHAKYDMY
jgi:vacuolar protein sorting-associated protein 18